MQLLLKYLNHTQDQQDLSATWGLEDQALRCAGVGILWWEDTGATCCFPRTLDTSWWGCFGFSQLSHVGQHQRRLPVGKNGDQGNSLSRESLGIPGQGKPTCTAPIRLAKLRFPSTICVAVLTLPWDGSVLLLDGTVGNRPGQLLMAENKASANRVFLTKEAPRRF